MFILSISSFSAEMLVSLLQFETTTFFYSAWSQNLFMFNNHYLIGSISKAVRYAEIAVQKEIGKDEPPPLSPSTKTPV